MALAPVWIASPPEVHSALLSSGPGAGPLLSAAGVWNALSVEYASAADELTALLGTVQAGAWQGPSAEQYLAAHVPYLVWLTQASADSAGVAAQHEVAAAAYTSALATMPTLPELAANRMTHGVLVATNFFGINTIPIALNEADYARMWIQAATTMGTYHAVSGAALASAPRPVQAPPVLKADSAAPAADSPPASGDFFTDLWNQLVRLFEDPIGTIQAILANPSAWLPLLFVVGYQAIFQPVGWTTWSLVFASPALLAIILGAALNLLADGEMFAPVAVAAPVPAGVAPAADRIAVVAGFGPSVATPGAAGVPGPPAPSAPAAPAPAAGTTAFGYLVAGAHPGSGVGPTLTGRDKAQAPASRVPAPAAAVGVSAREKARARRRRRAVMRDHADEFMDLDAGAAADAAPPPAAHSAAAGSDRGTGALGFTGTVGPQAAATAAGLATLGDGFGGGPNMPMLPDTWGEQDFADSAGEPEPEPKKK